LGGEVGQGLFIIHEIRPEGIGRRSPGPTHTYKNQKLNYTVHRAEKEMRDAEAATTQKGKEDHRRGVTGHSQRFSALNIGIEIYKIKNSRREICGGGGSSKDGDRGRLGRRGEIAAGGAA